MKFLSIIAASSSIPAGFGLLVSCSGGPLAHEVINDSQSAGSSAIPGGTSADVRVKAPDEASDVLSLVSSLPTETMLNSFITTVNAPAGSTYRFALEDGENAVCNRWGEFTPLSEPLNVTLGADGPKTLCVQHKDKNGSLGNPLIIPFRKRSVLENGPYYSLFGLPSNFTAASSSKIFINGGDVAQYRFSFVFGQTCGTLEASPWRDAEVPIDNLNFRFDGAWTLCLDVRDKFGNKNRRTLSHTWTRDTVYPVIDELPIASGVTQDENVTFNISGSQVFEYQHVLVDGTSTCSNVTYSAFTPITTPLKISLPNEDQKTLCILTRSEAGLVQRLPYIKPIRRVRLKATVTIQPIAVRNSGGTVVAVNSNRRFLIGGVSVTHYKAVSLDRDANCDNQTRPTSAPIPVSTPLDLTFSTSGIKTLCVWGAVVANGSESYQSTPTYVRFHNDTNNSTRITSTTLTPFTTTEAVPQCSRCHSYFNDAAYQTNAVAISTRLRHPNPPRVMPIGGFSSAEVRSRYLLYLYNIPGYPQDLPQVMQP